MKLIFKLFYTSLLFVSILNANENVDCIILEDENSIICKYSNERYNQDRNVTFNWHEPNGNLSRQREITIPSGHGSVYDFRYIKGRVPGQWTLKVNDNNQTFKTNFIIE